MQISSHKKSENIHIVFWLFKDAAWCMNIKWLGLSMIIPTISVAIFLLYKQWHDADDRFHNMAILCWIVANSIWMIGEFFHIDEGAYGLRTVAIFPFSIGILCIGYYYLIYKQLKKTKGI